MLHYGDESAKLCSLLMREEVGRSPPGVMHAPWHCTKPKERVLSSLMLAFDRRRRKGKRAQELVGSEGWSEESKLGERQPQQQQPFSLCAAEMDDDGLRSLHGGRHGTGSGCCSCSVQ
jgi:hypothetical protein